MAAALCHLAKERSGPKILLQALINPVLDLSCNGTLERQEDSLDLLRWQVLQYLSDPKDASNHHASPLLADDVSNLPSAVILLAELDSFYESGKRYGERLKAAGVPTLIYCQKGTNHLAGNAAKVSLLARESLDVAVDAIKNAFLLNKYHEEHF